MTSSVVTVTDFWLFAGAHAIFIAALMLRSVVGRMLRVQ